MICNSCQTDKDLLSFSKNSSRKTGYDQYCKQCRSDYVKKWRKTDRGAKTLKKTRRKFYLENKDYELAKSRQWRRGKKAGTPSWLTEEHHKEIQYVYSLARECSIITGERYEVDHIIPINGKNVCGLHVPWNLQILPRDLNSAKSNNVVM